MTVTVLCVSLALNLTAAAPAAQDAAYQHALRLMVDHKPAEAIAALERLLRSWPDYDPARYELANAHRMQGLETALKGPSQGAEARRHFQLAAGQFRRLAEGSGDYKLLAIMQLVMIYGDDELGQPADVIPFARQYVALSPQSAAGHIALANALRSTQQEPAGAATLLAARNVVRADDSRLLATMMVEYVVKAQTSSTADLKSLLDWADRVVDGLLRAEPGDRNLLLTRAASASFRADRLESNPARKRALKLEADRAFERFEAANPNRAAAPPAPSFADLPPPPPPPPPRPSGFDAAMADSDRLLASKHYAAAAAVWETLIKSNPGFPPAYYMRANALLLAGQRPAAEAAVKAARTSIGAAPDARHQAATYILDMVTGFSAIGADGARMLLREARTMLDDALQKRPDYWEATASKSDVLRMQARYETDPATVKSLTDEADRLSAQATALRHR
jgi:tetratricopeptide (TPR) repeat protein